MNNEDIRQWMEPTKRDGTLPAREINLREHFAGLAMQGLLANSVALESWTLEECISKAVSHADALIAELNK